MNDDKPVNDGQGTPETTDSTASTPSVIEAPVQATKTSKFTKRTKLFIAGGVVAVLALGLGAFALLRNSEPTKTPATSQSNTKKFGVAVGLTEGLAQYSSDAKSWKDLTADTDLKEGDSVRTTDNSRVVLLIDDGSAVRLDSNSELKLTSLSTTSIVITNTAGELYNRVTASETREYKVAVGSETYKAKGTAYRTFNESDKQGVEVFQSTVEATKEKQEVTEGKYLFSKHPQADKQGSVLALDIEALKADAFIKWNSEQDKKVAEFANKLGILTEIDKPAPAAPAAPATPSAGGITLTGKASEYSAVFSWKISGVDASKGYKLVRSKKTTTPTYPGDSVAYIEAGKTSYTLYVGDDTAYNYRICTYTGSSCSTYSNTVSVTTLKKVKQTLVPGAVTAVLNANTVSWSIAGTAPFGYKVVVSKTSGPTFESNYKKYFTESTSYNLPGYDYDAGQTYYIKVCKYNDGCTDYSNELVYTP